MAFKIEMRILNITNYPSVAKHFEDMASKGWLINKIISNSIFIYKRIEPEELDFSISPYEVETMFTKKKKSELQEFQSVSESVGWNYAAKSTDLHIYFKEKGSQAIDMETDDEEEFKTIERIAKRELIGMYLLALTTLFITYIILFGRIIHVDLMRSGILQVLSPLFLILLVPSIVQIHKIKKFLKINKKNIEMGEEIEYKNSGFYFEKIIYLLITTIIILSIVYMIYVGVILKNNNILMNTLPGLVGITIATLFRIVAKPSNRDSGTKRMSFFIGIIIILIMIPLLNGSAAGKYIGRYNNLDPSEYKVLAPNGFVEKEKTYAPSEGKILQDISLLVPKSYEYAYYDEEDKYIKTEYSNVLTEDLAKTLVGQYIKRSEEDSNRYMWSPEFSLEEDKENLWKLDQVYYLNKRKTEILIRDGKEVFYLEGKDFSDSDIIKTTKNRLDL